MNPTPAACAPTCPSPQPQPPICNMEVKTQGRKPSPRGSLLCPRPLKNPQLVSDKRPLTGHQGCPDRARDDGWGGLSSQWDSQYRPAEPRTERLGPQHQGPRLSSIQSRPLTTTSNLAKPIPIKGWGAPALHTPTPARKSGLNAHSCGLVVSP